MSEVSDLTTAVAAEGLIVPGGPLVVLYSGGRDSTCLLDVARTIAGAGSVRALHVNYGLRASADGDEAHCAAVCADLGIALRVHRPGPPPATGNRQAWARDARYGAARRDAARAGVSAPVAAGHTATDQVETILYRLASSPSRRALLGMRPRDGDLVRPLLGFTRAQTAAHCRARGLAWRDDETNDGDTYARGRVRHGLVPALERVHPAAAANVRALAELLSAEAAVLDELVDGILGGAASAGALPEISVATLRAQPPALRRLLVQRLADAAAGGSAPGVARRAEEVAALPQTGVADLHLPYGVRARVRRGVIRFDRTPPPPHRPAPGSGGRLPRLPRMSAEATSGEDPAIGKILVGPEELVRRVSELAAEINRDYAGRDLLLIGVLKGAVFFVSDLMRQITVPVEVDFMAVASYGSATRSSGVVRILKDLDAAIEGRDVLIVEDIVDSGLTLQYLQRNLAGRNPASLEVCALLIKPERRKVQLRTRYIGFEIPDEFAIGYGLDHAERYRNLPYVAALQT